MRIGSQGNPESIEPDPIDTKLRNRAISPGLASREKMVFYSSAPISNALEWMVSFRGMPR